MYEYLKQSIKNQIEFPIGKYLYRLFRAESIPNIILSLIEWVSIYFFIGFLIICKLNHMPFSLSLLISFITWLSVFVFGVNVDI